MLVSVVPRSGGGIQWIFFGTCSLAAGDFGESFGTFDRPGGDSVFFEIIEVYICTEIVPLKCKSDMIQIIRTCDPGFIKGIFQLLNAAGNGVVYIGDSIRRLWVFCFVGALRRLHKICALSGTFLHHECKNQINII